MTDRERFNKWVERYGFKVLEDRGDEVLIQRGFQTETHCFNPDGSSAGFHRPEILWNCAWFSRA